MSCVIQNKEHLIGAIKFARRLGGKSKSSFRHAFHVLNRIKRHYKGILEIYPDWVDHSFGFIIRVDDRTLMHGGIILHGFQETFAVELTQSNYPHWSIHT